MGVESKMKEEINKIIEDFSQIHKEDCSCLDENSYELGCTCAVKNIVKEVLEKVVEFISHDIKCDNEEQRKEVVKIYLDNFI